MKIRLVAFILLLTGITSGYAQDTTAMKQINEPYIFGVPEIYDYKHTNNGAQYAIYERSGWVIEVWEKKEFEEGTSYEYAPASEFYKIINYYHPGNGMLKKRGKTMMGIPFGKWEYFDKEGKLIEVEDKDAQYKGINTNHEDVLVVLEKEGVINRQTGAHSIIDNETARGVTLRNPLPTNGSFYRKLEFYIDCNFKPAEIKEGKEVSPPVWFASVTTFDEATRYKTTYKIDARTGKYTIHKYSKSMLNF